MEPRDGLDAVIRDLQESPHRLEFSLARNVQRYIEHFVKLIQLEDEAQKAQQKEEKKQKVLLLPSCLKSFIFLQVDTSSRLSHER